MAKEITIGRANANDVVLAYPSISRKHASIHLVDNKEMVFHVHDFGSANGTFKNGERVSDAEFHAHNDRISIAHIDLKPSHFLPYFYDELAEAAALGVSTSERVQYNKVHRLSYQRQIFYCVVIKHISDQA